MDDIAGRMLSSKGRGSELEILEVHALWGRCGLKLVSPEASNLCLHYWPLYPPRLPLELALQPLGAAVSAAQAGVAPLVDSTLLQLPSWLKRSVTSH